MCHIMFEHGENNDKPESSRYRTSNTVDNTRDAPKDSKYDEGITIKIEEILLQHQHIFAFKVAFPEIDLFTLTKSTVEKLQDDVHRQLASDLKIWQEAQALAETKLKNGEFLTHSEEETKRRIEEDMKILAKKSEIIQSCLNEVDSFIKEIDKIKD